MTPTAEAENPELHDMTRRFWVSLALSVPLLAMVDFPPWSGGVRSERHAAARMVIPSMLARASAGVR